MFKAFDKLSSGIHKLFTDFDKEISAELRSVRRPLPEDVQEEIVTEDEHRPDGTVIHRTVITRKTVSVKTK